MQWVRLHRSRLLIGGVLLALLVAWAIVRSVRARVPEVGVEQATVGPLTLRIAASGLVQAPSSDLSFQGSGRIVALYVEEGDVVSKSATLARVMPQDPVSDNVGSPDTIQAPADGSIVTIYQRPGAVVSPGQAVVRFIPTGERWVTAYLESEDAPHIRPGQLLRCRAGGYLSEAWDLTVAEVGREAIARPDLAGAARQVPVRCAVPGSGFPLAPGSEVDIDGEVPLVTGAVLVSTAAVVHEGTHDSVWVVTSGTVHKREVRVGPNNFDQIQLREGVTEGETVVVEGKQDLQEGRRVRVAPTPPRRGAGPGGE